MPKQYPRGAVSAPFFSECREIPLIYFCHVPKITTSEGLWHEIFRARSTGASDHYTIVHVVTIYKTCRFRTDSLMLFTETSHQI